ncbi:MAG: hypothetical protein GXO48_01755 [Chlorobi bacterium]|nr:hypothetical protein [Chlorobiota bacterium]
MKEIIFSSFVFFLIFRLLVNIIYFLFPFEILDTFYPLYEWQWYLIWFGLPAITGLLLAIHFHNKLLARFGIGSLFITVFFYVYVGGLLYLTWNYPFKRPAVFSELLDAKQVMAIVDFEHKPTNSIMIMDYLLTYRICYDYYCLLERPLVAFYEANARIDTNKNIDTSIINEIIQNIKENDFLPEPASPYYYESANSFTARLVKFKTHRAEIYYHLSVRTGEVDNDHYALCEFLVDGESLHVVKNQCFFYDVAGVEFLDYAGLPILLETFMLLVLSISYLVLYYLIKHGIVKIEE